MRIRKRGIKYNALVEIMKNTLRWKNEITGEVEIHKVLDGMRDTITYIINNSVMRENENEYKKGIEIGELENLRDQIDRMANNYAYDKFY